MRKGFSLLEMIIVIAIIITIVSITVMGGYSLVRHAEYLATKKSAVFITEQLARYYDFNGTLPQSGSDNSSGEFKDFLDDKRYFPKHINQPYGTGYWEWQKINNQKGILYAYTNNNHMVFQESVDLSAYTSNIPFNFPHEISENSRYYGGDY